MSNNVEKHVVEIEKVDADQFCLTFDPNVLKNSYDGHKWELLVKAYLKDKKIILEEVTHDPESDMYSALASKKEPLEEIAAVIEVLVSNHDLCEKYVKSYDQLAFSEDDDMSTEEFINWMNDAGYNMNSSRIFKFDLDHIQDEKQAEDIKNVIENKGYKTKVETYDGEVFFELRANIKPNLKDVLEIESFLESVAKKYNVKYIGFGIN